jgi:hypothetical protein
VPNVLTAEVLAKLRIPPEQFNASFEGMMRAGLERLAALQRPTGGWGWFDADAEDPFMTACAVHGLSECERLGRPVDAVMLRLGRARLREMAAAETDLNRLAYEAFALGEGFERLLESRRELSSYAKSLLALALHRAGRREAPEVARELAAEVRGDHWETPRWYYKWDDVSIETTAYAVQALAAIEPSSPLIGRGTEWLLAQRRDGRWKSTKDTAVAVVTLLKAASLESVAALMSGPRETGTLRLGLSPDGGARREAVIDFDNPLRSTVEAHAPLRAGARRLVLEPLDGRDGVPLEAEITMRVAGPAAAPESKGLRIEVEADRALDGLRIGDEVEFAVRVSAEEAVDYVMVEVPVPAGGEVVGGSGQGGFARFEARYEKALFFLRSVGPEGSRLTFRMRCAFGGRFTVLPATASLMYDESIRATGAAGTAVVR